MTSGRPRLAAVRRAVGLAVVLVLLGCAFAFYRAAPKLPKSTVPLPASAADATPTSGPTTPAPTSADPASPKRRAGATTRRDAVTGPGRTAVGIYVAASPAADGSFDVAESVVLSSPVSVLKLRVPPIGDGGSVFRSMHARATEVQVSAGSQPVAVPDAEVAADADVPLAVAATKFELRYRLTGVTIRSPGSTAGRALAALGPLTSGVPLDLPVATAVRGRAVLNLRCPYLRLKEQACSAGSDGNLRVNRTLPWHRSLVVVQLDLPTP